MNFEDYVKFLNSELTVVKGVGEKKSALFAKLGIKCVWDLLYNFPYDYEDRTVFNKIVNCPLGEPCCIKAIPRGSFLKKMIKRNISIYTLTVADDTGVTNIKWFSNSFYKYSFDNDKKYVFYGTMTEHNGKKEFEMKSFEEENSSNNTGVILPIYHSVAGLNQATIRQAVKQCLSVVESIIDAMPDKILKKYKLMGIDSAIRSMHNPKNFTDLSKARERLVFEELFVLSLSLTVLKSRRNSNVGIAFKNVSSVADFAKTLPFELTDSQKSVVNEICLDLKSGRVMNRLLQGDVGSGKTVVAACSAYCAYKNGYQSAIMAPTEVLSKQHFETFNAFFKGSLNIALLTSSTPNKENLLKDIADGKYDIIIGTHALIEEKVEFKNLALCITDEQHRFGVNQRAKLFEKGVSPHVLVMSATPIPRTLSLILYGDLDVSIIKSLPKGRIPISTYCVKSDYHDRVYGFVKEHLKNGRQCYVVCPLVEKSESLDVVSGTEFHQKLSNGVLKGFNIGLLHGKMKISEKDAVMDAFKSKKIDVLVSTTVIEVGVDVPNANIIVIENAERFGLSQLHQLRGRVGRGEHKSYCILVTDNDSKETMTRMNTMVKTNDGFEISQKDLELRGSGEFFGTRQHGLPELKVANLFTDIEILKLALNAAKDVTDEDKFLESEDLSLIRARIQKIFGDYDNFNIFN